MSKEADLPTLNSLLAFEATIRHRSMTLAADELSITQPLVSQRIRALEDVMGGILVDRSQKPLMPTPEGQAFYNELRGATSSILRATSNTKAKLRDTKTRISISAYFGFSFYWIMPRLHRLQQAFPDVHFEILPTHSLADLSNSQADILFHFATNVGQYQFEQLLIPEEVFPVCSPSLAEKFGLRVGQLLTDLRDFPLLHKDIDDVRWVNWRKWSETLNVALPDSPVDFFYHNYPLVVEAAISGKGFCLGWKGIIDHYLEEGKLIEFEPRLTLQNRGYHICTNHYSSLLINRVVQWFIDEI